jgi:hypothetical protein
LATARNSRECDASGDQCDTDAKVRCSIEPWVTKRTGACAEEEKRSRNDGALGVG